MPAYDPPVHIRVSPGPRHQQAVGAVIEFQSTDAQRIQQWLDRAVAAGIIKPTTARTYNAEWGAPVWYVP